MVNYVSIRITSCDSMFLWWKLIVYVLFKFCVIFNTLLQSRVYIRWTENYCILLNTDDFYLYFFPQLFSSW